MLIQHYSGQAAVEFTLIGSIWFGSHLGLYDACYQIQKRTFTNAIGTCINSMMFVSVMYTGCPDVHTGAFAGYDGTTISV